MNRTRYEKREIKYVCGDTGWVGGGGGEGAII
jgi:hypothetical protein